MHKIYVWWYFCFILADRILLSDAAIPSWTKPSSDTTFSLDRSNLNSDCVKITELKASSNTGATVRYSVSDGGKFDIGDDLISGNKKLTCSGNEATLTESSYTVTVKAFHQDTPRLSADRILIITIPSDSDCNEPTATEHATIVKSNGNAEGSEATYTCESGYTHTAGAEKLTCTSGTWSGELPTCSQDCNEPTATEHATIVKSNGNAEGSEATYTCENGYTHTAGAEKLTCTSGTWSGELPTCSQDHGNAEGSEATYTCVSRYTRTAGAEKCTSGTWNGELPNCSQDCNEPTATEHATIVKSNGNAEGSEATYTCDSGYKRTAGAEKLTCTSGTWNGELPTCSQECLKDTFGVECSRKCFCAEGTCTHDNGTCSGKCRSGYRGPHCNEAEESEMENKSLIIGVAVAVSIALIVVAVIIGVVVCRARHKNRSSGTNVYTKQDVNVTPTEPQEYDPLDDVNDVRGSESHGDENERVTGL